MEEPGRYGRIPCLKDTLHALAKVMDDRKISAIVDAYLADNENRFGQPQFTSYSLQGQGTSIKPHESKGAGHQGHYPNNL